MIALLTGIILLVIFIVVAIVCSQHASMTSIIGGIFLVAAVIFLVLAIIMGLGLAGVSV